MEIQTVLNPLLFKENEKKSEKNLTSKADGKFSNSGY